MAGITNFFEPSMSGIRNTWLGPGASAVTIAAASPLSYVDAGDPPGYVIHGDWDNIVPMTQGLALAIAGVRAGMMFHMFYDRVDDGSVSCRGHAPFCGMNIRAYLDWLDLVDRGAMPR